MSVFYDLSEKISSATEAKTASRNLYLYVMLDSLETLERRSPAVVDTNKYQSPSQARGSDVPRARHP